MIGAVSPPSPHPGRPSAPRPGVFGMVRHSLEALGSKGNAVLETTAGLLLLIAGLVPLTVGPGITFGVEFSVDLLAMAIAFVGALVLVHATYSAVRAIIHSDEYEEDMGTRVPNNPWARPTAIGTGATVFVAMVLISFGALPGAEYYGSSGSVLTAIYGCGHWLGGTSSPTPPDAFPPHARVHLTWTSVNGTLVSFRMTENPPNSYALEWQYDANGSSGAVTLLGTGGDALWSATHLNASSCPTLEYVLVNWSYALVV